MLKYKKKMIYYIIIDISIKILNGINSKIKMVEKIKNICLNVSHETFYIVNIIKQIIWIVKRNEE